MMQKILGKAKEKISEAANQHQGGQQGGGHQGGHQGGGGGPQHQGGHQGGPHGGPHGGFKTGGIGGLSGDGRGMHLGNRPRGPTPKDPYPAPGEISDHPIYPQPGQRPPGPGKMPPKAKRAHKHPGIMRFYHPKGPFHDTLRDLGFSGVIDGKIVWTFGDTMMGNEKNHMICATDSTSIGDMHDRMGQIDTALWPNMDSVKEWIPCNPEEEKNGGLSAFAFGGTNIIEYAPNQGLVYYLKIHRPGGKVNIRGAGVAHVKMNGDIPEATRVGVKLWSEWEPMWGDVGICYNSQDKHIYVYGHGPNWDPELAARTYLCRAPVEKAGNVGAYEYWLNDVRQWTKQRLARGHNGTLKIEQKHAIFQWYQMNQSSPFWSNYFNKWMFLSGTSFSTSDVICWTADRLEGPWHEHGSVCDTKPRPGEPEASMRYCHTGHPEYDPSGKTVFVTWTMNNTIRGATIEWE